jgi:hypothetical protein
MAGKDVLWWFLAGILLCFGKFRLLSHLCLSLSASMDSPSSYFSLLIDPSRPWFGENVRKSLRRQ